MSAPLAPICVPVELSRAEKGAPGPRWFRLALGINEDSLRLRSPVPEELAEGPIAVRLHLPEDPDPNAPAPGALQLTALAEEVVVDEGEETERAERVLLRLRGTPESARARVAGYVSRRLLL